MNKLDEKGLIKESESAKAIFIEGQKILLIVVKRDGGFSYASTECVVLSGGHLYLFRGKKPIKGIYEKGGLLQCIEK